MKNQGISKKSQLLFLFGSPGAGKGTIADFLQDNYNFIKISSGDLLRERIEIKDKVALNIKNMIDNGTHVPDQFIPDQFIPDQFIPDQFIIDLFINRLKKNF